MMNENGACPLTGKPCDKDKIILVMQTVDGKTTKFAICPDCASNFENVDEHPDSQWRTFLETVFQGMHISQMFDPVEIDHIIGSIKNYDDLNQFMNMLVSKPKRPGAKKCKNCGLPLEELFRTGKLGCADCWSNLQPWVGQIVFKAQEGGKIHIGKRPKNHKAKQEDTIEELEQKLSQAVKEERYEDAAVIRDVIKARRS